MRYAHTNIITKDWQRLAKFYCEAFSCIPVPPERRQSGAWLDRGTGLHGAEIQGVHLRLPGYDVDGPTLEIYQYSQIVPCSPPRPNRQGLGHLAFEVEDVSSTMVSVLRHGGSMVGDVSEAIVDGVGKLTFLYMADPDGNLLELQHWD